MVYLERPKIQRSDSPPPRALKRIDLMRGAARELFFIEHPEISEHTKEGKRKFNLHISKLTSRAVWIHYPWLQTAIHLPDEETYLRLRTARNRNLITDEEQRAYRKGVLGIAGLSVGSVALSALVATGGPKVLKLADPDFVEIKNLNRMRAQLSDVGENKAEVAARHAWELDPFAKIEIWSDGLRESTLDRFIGRPKLEVLVDEMDDIALKYAVRERCKKMRVPVIMATDVGDGAVVDVERFDREPTRPMFHGRVTMRASGPNIDRKAFIRAAKEIIDPLHFSHRQKKSIAAVGKTLSGIPQLGSAAMIGGAAVAYAVRMIVTGEEMPSGRYVLKCEDAFQKTTSV